MGFPLAIKRSVRVHRPPQPSSPYLEARTNFESLFRDQAKEKHAWKIAALGELALILVLVLAYVRLASGARMVPYVVEVDQLGRAAAFGPAEMLKRVDDRLIIHQLTLFVRNLRSVTTDPAVQVRQIDDAYAYVTPAAARFLNDYFADPRNNPRVLAQTLTRDVDVTGVLRVPNSDSWRIQWTETDHSLVGGVSTRTAWEAYVTTKLVPPTSAEAIQANPLGLYVSALNWTRLNSISDVSGGAP